MALYDMDGNDQYIIAELASSVSLIVEAADLEAGGITSFSLSAVDSSTVQEVTTFEISLRPEHSIPSDNVIEITFPTDLAVANSASCSITDA